MDNMKNIKELNLELIELEDQVLLVDDKKLIINGYIHRGTEKPVINKPDFWFDFGVPYKNVIASTKPLEGLPLLVIEDEERVVELFDYIENLSKTLYNPERHRDESIKSLISVACQSVYNKTKETYKFTEEDLKKALWELGDVLFNNNQNGITEGEPELYFDTIIQSLTKKELCIEIEDKIAIDGHTIIGVEPKIVNNQIKAIWK